MAQTEKLEFGAETGKILNLMIHSLYTNKEIFLRELISNSADACDKLRYLAVADQNLSKVQEFKISIIINEKERTISLSDNGIGMNREDLIQNIGTIASSGTQKFLEKMTGNDKKDHQLIGQFGVGFYSAFMVADKVEMITKKAGSDDVWEWVSDGQNSYEIKKADKSEAIEHGTSIKLYLKEGMDEFLDSFRIKHIVKTYSDHIPFSIELTGADDKAEIINSGAALWAKDKNSITNDQYKDFYKSVAMQPDDPWLIMHNKNEGVVEFTNLLFIPSQKPFDLFHPDRKSRVKLFVKKVFIADEGIDLVPSNLRFLRGVVDSEDLPLNISRESLQYNSVISKIQKSITKKVYTELKKKLDKETESYNGFWTNFGACLKEGLCEATDNKESILDICLFKSALKDKLITLKEYIDDMKEKQNKIFFLRGEEGENATRY